jgi:uncharacterized phage protein (TIGR02218 family)
MSDPFYDDEASIESSFARELYDVSVAGRIFYFNSGIDDFLYNGIVYYAEAGVRSNLTVLTSKEGAGEALSVTLRVNHDLVKRWFKIGVPPQQATVSVRRYQQNSQVLERLWSGKLVAVDASGVVAKLTVAGKFGEPMRSKLPVISAGKACVHVLYDSRCRVDRSLFSRTTSVLWVDGRDIRVDLGPDRGSDWALFGEVYFSQTGDRMTISKQTDLTITPGVSSIVKLTMQMPIIDLVVGSSVQVFAGCDHDITTCQAKFANQINYGGFPQMPTRNPFLQTGFGVVEQT